MMLDAELARKLDADRIEFENLKIDAYSDDDKKIYVELPRSIFNLTTRILTSESRVLIRREDFELVGDAGRVLHQKPFRENSRQCENDNLQHREFRPTMNRLLPALLFFSFSSAGRCSAAPPSEKPTHEPGDDRGSSPTEIRRIPLESGV